MISRINPFILGIVLVLPFFTCFFALSGYAQEKEALQLNSEAVILMDAVTGQILYEKNINKSMYPASITKIVTGIIAIEEGNLDDTVTVSQQARNIDGTRVYLAEGEQVSLLKLVQGLLINSGNDAGTAIAEYFAGSEEGFAKQMNQLVQDKIGVTNSNFTNPHGLFDSNHYTTAYDMAMITQYAMKNELFREIVSTKELEWVGEEWETTIYNHHRLLWDYEGTTGVKNGFVHQSGYTLVTTAQRDNMELITVTLKAASAQHAYQDTIALMDYGFSNYETIEIPKGKVFFDLKQNEYHVAEDIYFTSRSDEEVTLEVRNGELLVKDADQEVIIKHELDKKEEMEEGIEEQEVLNQVKIKNSEYTQPTYQRFFQYTLWVCMLLYQLFLFLICYLLIRKYKLL